MKELNRYSLQCTLGHVALITHNRAIVALSIGSPEQVEAEFSQTFPGRVLPATSGRGPDWLSELTGFCDNMGPAPGIPLAIGGTPFQQRIWSELRAIRPGQTLTYSELAKKAGRPRAARAAAGACAANRIALLIPCHRVVRADGQAGGYRWGLSLKEHLLAREADIEPATKQ